MKNSEQSVMPLTKHVPQRDDYGRPTGEYILDSTIGLTKREHFASMAMQGYIASGATHADAARWGIAAADALLAELEKPSTNL